jgi:hypothetical protein
MRGLTDADRLRRFMAGMGAEASANARIYLTGGASAVLLGWRANTVDIDIKIVPEDDRLYRAIPELKERLQVNVELASPADFLPELSGWETRSPFIAQEGRVAFHHYDFYAQALAKIERGHAQDVQDVEHMLEQRLVEPRRVLQFLDEIQPRLYRYPAVDPPAFRRAVEQALQRYL